MFLLKILIIIIFLKLGSIIQKIEVNVDKGIIPEHNAIYFTILWWKL